MLTSGRGRERSRVAGFVVVAAVMCAAGAQAAPAGATSIRFTHSAESGELQGGRLTLHGVSSRVLWIDEGGRSGRVAVRRMHRDVFLPGRPARGRLRLAGHHGGDRGFLLSRPRYDAAHRTVSYRAKRVAASPSPRGAARASGRHDETNHFGNAKLTITPHPRINGNEIHNEKCRISLRNDTEYTFAASAERKWDTDTWWHSIPFEATLGPGQMIVWGSDGGWYRGCSVGGTWITVPDDTHPNPPPESFDLDLTYVWADDPSQPEGSCKASTNAFQCIPATGTDSKQEADIWGVLWATFVPRPG